MKKITNIRNLLFIGFIMFSNLGNVWAAQGFKIQDIELVGAKRVTLATVITYLPVKKGDFLDRTLTQNSLRTLYKTGFFKDVKLTRRGNTLVVRVIERPAISEIEIKGNFKVKDDDILKAFADVGLARGRIFNDNDLDKMQQELQRLYYSFGKYSVKMDTNVEPLPRNRIKIKIDIAEGLSTKIKQINIVGNKIFTDKKLLKELKSGIPSWYALFSSRDEYSQVKLAGDLEILESYYLDRGYINFKIESTQVTITPDKKDIYITINISEGELYQVDDIKLVGPMVIPKEDLEKTANLFVSLDKHYSRKNIVRAEEALKQQLGNVGYAFANIAVIPEVDEEKREVDIVFNLNPEKKVYVRRIIFSGNSKTVDEVYRREMRQMEGGVYSNTNIERSRVRVQRLSFVENVTVDTPVVLDADDQVDVVYEITERLSGSFNIGIGANEDGTIFSLGLTQNNLFGTGNALSLSVNRSDVVKSFDVTYTQPYYTVDGVSRRVRTFLNEIDTDDTVLADFLSETKGGEVSYGFPVTEFSRFNFGVTAANTKITGTNFTVSDIRDFLEVNGSDYNILSTTTSYIHDTRNRSIFANKGSRNVFQYELAIPGSDLEYYKFTYRAEHYWALTRRTGLLFKYDIGYGEGLDDLKELPFFEKFTTGGIRSLRGYEARSLGPVDSNGDPFGGDLKTVGSIEYNLPQPTPSARISLFYDFGNVFESSKDFDTNEFRSSIGISARWLTPVGPLIFSYSAPVNDEPGDDVERFQFSIGGSF